MGIDMACCIESRDMNKSVKGDSEWRGEPVPRDDSPAVILLIKYKDDLSILLCSSFVKGRI